MIINMQIKLHASITIIRSKFFFLFIGREPTTWPANDCLQTMVCSGAMLSNRVWLQIIFCLCIKETVLFSFLRSLLSENERSMVWSIWNNHFHLLPQFKNELFHILLIISLLTGDMNSINWPPSLHSSVGRATHLQRGGHGFESCWSPDFFQASSFQLLKLENLLRWSFFAFIFFIFWNTPWKC